MPFITENLARPVLHIEGINLLHYIIKVSVHICRGNHIYSVKHEMFAYTHLKRIISKKVNCVGMFALFFYLKVCFSSLLML